MSCSREKSRYVYSFGSASRAPYDNAWRAATNKAVGKGQRSRPESLLTCTWDDSPDRGCTWALQKNESMSAPVLTRNMRKPTYHFHKGDIDRTLSAERESPRFVRPQIDDIVGEHVVQNRDFHRSFSKHPGRWGPALAVRPSVPHVYCKAGVSRPMHILSISPGNTQSIDTSRGARKRRHAFVKIVNQTQPSDAKSNISRDTF